MAKQNKIEVLGKMPRGHAKGQLIHIHDEINKLLDERFAYDAKSTLVNFLALHYLGMIDLAAEEQVSVHDINKLLKNASKS